MVEKAEVISLKQFTPSQKIMLIQGLGYQTDGKFVLDEGGEIVKDKYLGVPVQMENMVILPGSTIVLDDNELSISLYIEEYGDPFG